MSAFSETDHSAMRRALELAERGARTTHPNPRVGAVILRDGRCVGEGWHERAGEPHAEVYALRMAGERARGATAYVTLEPCSHHGKTPPCADALVAAGVARVVYAAGDPDPRVDGRGAARLVDAGIRVQRGLLEPEALELNIGFMQRVRLGRPFVRIKLAASLDGRTALASGESQWITSATAREDVQHWRARSSAILTGIGTVLADDPKLTVRIPAIEFPAQPGAPAAMHAVRPLRLIADSRFRTPLQSRLLAEAGEVRVVGVSAAGAQAWSAGWQAGRAASGASSGSSEVAQASAACVPANAQGHIDLGALIHQLGAERVNELHVEAGATLSGALIAAGLADELLLYLAPTLLGPDARPLLHLPALASLADRGSWHLHDVAQLGPDLRLRLRPGPDSRQG